MTWSLDSTGEDKRKDGRLRSNGGIGSYVWIVEGEIKRKDGRVRSKRRARSGVWIAEGEIRLKMVG